MGYLQEFKAQVSSSNYPGLLHLWEEYCGSEIVDGLELRDILSAIKESDLSPQFGSYVELALPLWKTIEDPALSYGVLKLIVDLETTNSEELGDICYNTIKERYGDHEFIGEKMRLIGLRSRESFQGCLSNYELLTHLNKGKFVFHTGGWGTGEILEISLVREELILEFENVIGRKDFTFKNAFKHLIPLSDDNFLSRRFGDPDALEEFARKEPVQVIRMLLRDLGPRAASEVKDELCELVIPEEDWTKWWQSARAKVKKDTKIETPTNIRDPFILRESELSHEERFKKILEKKVNVDDIILTVYNFVRDFNEIFKNEEIKQYLRHQLDDLLDNRDPSSPQKFQIYVLLESLFDEEGEAQRVRDFIKTVDDIEALVQGVDIIAFKKRALRAVRQYRGDWTESFLSLISTIQQTPLRDYLLKELNKELTRELLDEKLLELLNEPAKNPEAFVWYFQKVVGEEDIPFSDKEHQCRFFESFLVLLSKIENSPDYHDLVKKMINILSAKRYAVVRAIMEDTSIEEVQEFLLLASKIHSLSSHDLKILRSLAAVVHPSLAKRTKRKDSHGGDDGIIWTTEQGYNIAADRVKHLSQVEVVENAREIEAARAHGDLRENSEYKFALERRTRLQAEIKLLSDSLNVARILTPGDIAKDEAGVGSIIDLTNAAGESITYTLLGPWDADPENGVLSFQSKLAQAMVGRKVGESFDFQSEEFTVTGIKSFLDA